MPMSVLELATAPNLHRMTSGFPHFLAFGLRRSVQFRAPVTTVGNTTIRTMAPAWLRSLRVWVRYRPASPRGGRNEPELEWSYLAPSAEMKPGQRTGKFRLGSDELLVDATGHSNISVQDYAVTMIDELERPEHVRQRFTVGY